ncbi:MAG: hypothetical protein K2M88_04645 [Muribaculaceae bacterium]|nr:hypothetical protein [Muribaculaceae bacterium]
MRIKGFSPRERQGLIALGIVVALCFSLGYIADMAGGCSRSAIEEQKPLGDESGRLKPLLSDSADDSAGSAISASDASIEETGGRAEMKNRKRKSSKVRKSPRKIKKDKTPPERRSFRDEPIQGK